MKKKVILLTGSELRHDFFRMRLAMEGRIELIQTYCEGTEKSLGALIQKEADGTTLRAKHLEAREQSEEDFFGAFAKTAEDRSRPLRVPKGAINQQEHAERIIDARPDIVMAYGCSIVKEPLLSAFAGRFLNVHLGISPYYRGSGTNYWPLVNGEPEFVGATFMHIDPGIDTGEIIHQMRARIVWGDTPSAIGNRLIGDIVPVYAAIAEHFEELPRMPQPQKLDTRVWKQKDYDEASVARLYEQFENGLIERYLSERETRWQRSPIVENPALAAFLR